MISAAVSSSVIARPNRVYPPDGHRIAAIHGQPEIGLAHTGYPSREVSDVIGGGVKIVHQ